MAIKRYPDPLGIAPDRVIVTREGKKFSFEDEAAIKKCLKFLANKEAVDALSDMYKKAAPRIIRDMKRQAGTKKERRPKITQWIEAQLKRDPDAKSPDLWSKAPEDVRDCIGYDRFCKRVTQAREKVGVGNKKRRK